MKNILILLFSLALLAADCRKISPVTHYCSITVKNNTSGTVAALLGYSYPDTSIPQDSLVGGILPGKDRFLDTKGYCDDVFKSLPRDTISVFVFDIDTLTRYPWNEIRNGYKTLKRYDVSLADLKNSNWTITYP